MTVVFYAGLICDDVYRLVVTRFEVFGYATAALRLARGKSLTEEEKGKIRGFADYGLTERQISLKLNTFKTVVHAFTYDPMNYIRNKRRGWTSEISVRCKRNVIRMAVQD